MGETPIKIPQVTFPGVKGGGENTNQDPASDIFYRKNCYHNGLRGYPEILPHQKQPILGYLEPPKSHIGPDRFLLIS